MTLTANWFKMRIDYRTTLFTVVLTLFFVKLAIVFFYQDEIEVWEDDVIARNMVATGEMFYLQRGTPNYMFQFPVYPSLLYVTYRAFGLEPFNAIVLNLVIISFTCFFLYKIFVDLGKMCNLEFTNVKPGFVALISVLAFQVHPFITYYSMFKVHPFVFDMIFPIIMVFLSLRMLKNPSSGNLGLLALSTGFGMLNRATAVLALLPFLILGIRELGTKKTLVNISLVSLISLFIVSPWLIRNYRLYNVFSMTMTGKEILWKGSLYNSDGSNYLLDGRTYKNALSRKESTFLQEKPIAAQEEFFGEKYKKILRKDPLHVIKMYLIKLRNFWLYHSNIGIEYSERIQSFLIMYKVYVYFILVLNLGAVFLFRFRPLVLVSYPIGLSLIQSIFYVETRHRMIVEPFLLFFSVLAVLAVWDRSTHIDKRQTIPPIQR